jgi:hypothetical protein
MLIFSGVLFAVSAAVLIAVLFGAFGREPGGDAEPASIWSLTGIFLAVVLGILHGVPHLEDASAKQKEHLAGLLPACPGVREQLAGSAASQMSYERARHWIDECATEQLYASAVSGK